MMNPYESLANRLQAALSLSIPPIAVSFGDEIPAGVPSFSGKVPAGCVFWEEAAKSSFATSTPDHELCAIGVHTHNFAQPTEHHGSELQEVLKTMVGLDYVREEEVAQIPVLNRTVNHVMYGPLSEQSLNPDLVLIFAHSQQGLILAEAVHREDKEPPLAMGRPACAALPQVMNSGRGAMSLGCCGARAYLDHLADDIALWVLPGAKIEAYCEQIEGLAKANQILAVFHQHRKEDVAMGKSPSVQESLNRL